MADPRELLEEARRCSAEVSYRRDPLNHRAGQCRRRPTYVDPYGNRFCTQHAKEPATPYAKATGAIRADLTPIDAALATADTVAVPRELPAAVVSAAYDHFDWGPPGYDDAPGGSASVEPLWAFLLGKLAAVPARPPSEPGHVELLANALGRILTAARVIRVDASLTGPELLNAAADYAESLAPPSPPAGVVEAAQVKEVCEILMEEEGCIYPVCECIKPPAIVRALAQREAPTVEAALASLPEGWFLCGAREDRTPIRLRGDKHEPIGFWSAEIQHRDGGRLTGGSGPTLAAAIEAAIQCIAQREAGSGS